ncbi:hypothetical protein J8F10_30050 [Gemmata sp. G18]|uniref:Uncharacterized protein n=1 Tax=Gemmata palustris TaxID=2822762 RepID=A0ABS5C0S3_9BACT|nr:hypothetical protein [Gemmata palustris]MBP3959508.1 hypothetical protein [Gemmata palustris]
MNRFEVANLTCLAVLVAAAIAGATAGGWPWWATLLAAAGAFFGGGLLVERIVPGTRLLRWLGWGGPE